MGQEEQQLKPEARKGDSLAKYAALVSSVAAGPTLSSTLTIRYRFRYW